MSYRNDEIESAARTFLGYGFVWGGAGLRGRLIPVRDVRGAGEAAAHVTRGSLSKLRALVRFLGAETRAEFGAALAVHLGHLPSWRAAVTDSAPQDLRSLCLLEVAPRGSSYRRKRFAGFTAASAEQFDFSAPGARLPLAQAASDRSGARVSCAAMMVLLDLQDELVNRADRGADARLAAAVMALYDSRPGAAPFAVPLRQRMRQIAIVA